MRDVESELIRGYCVSYVKLAHDAVYSLFALVQLFFVFKYGNVIVNKNKWLARFTFMHCACSSLSFWINSVIQETLDTLIKKLYSKEDKCDDYNKAPSENPSGYEYSNYYGDYDYEQYAGKDKMSQCNFNGSFSDIGNSLVCVLETRAKCNLDLANTKRMSTINHWFYPFSIEFSILIVAIWYILWSSIGKVDAHKNNIEFLPISAVTPHGSQQSLHRTQDGHKD